MQINGAATGAGTYAYSPSCPGVDDLGEAVAELQIQGESESEQVEDRIERSDEDLAEQQSDQEVKAMRDKADDVRAAGIVGGSIGIAAGALQGAGAIASANATPANAGSATSAPGASATAAAAQAGSVPGTVSGPTLGTWLTESAALAQASSKMEDGLFQSAELVDEANAKADADAADRATTAAKDAQEAASAAENTVDHAVEAAGQIQQTVASTNLTLAQRV